MRSMISEAFSDTISAGDFPPPLPPPLGCVSPICVSSAFASLLRNVRSALGCNPNISGESISGNSPMYPRNASMLSDVGTLYTKSPGIFWIGVSGLNVKVSEHASGMRYVWA